MDAPKIFLSYARADRKIAERLRTSLEQHGCVVHDPAANGGFVGSRVAVPWDDLKAAAQSSDQLVLLFGRHRDRDMMQEQEWQAALEASWDDESKKMIPVLIGDAELPNFVRGAAGTGRSSMGLHVNGPGEAEKAAELIARTVHEAPRAAPPLPDSGDRGLKTDPDRSSEVDFESRSFSLGVDDDENSDDRNSELVFTVEPPSREERAARFDAIRRYVEELKS